MESSFPLLGRQDSTLSSGLMTARKKIEKEEEGLGGFVSFFHLIRQSSSSSILYLSGWSQLPTSIILSSFRPKDRKREKNKMEVDRKLEHQPGSLLFSPDE